MLLSSFLTNFAVIIVICIFEYFIQENDESLIMESKLQSYQAAENEEQSDDREQAPKKEKRVRNLQKVVRNAKSWQLNPLFKVNYEIYLIVYLCIISQFDFLF